MMKKRPQKNFKSGDARGGSKPARPRPERAGSDRERPERGTRFERSDRPARAERPGRPDRREHTEKAEWSERRPRSARPGRPDRPEHTEKAEWSERRPRSARPARPDRRERSEGFERRDRPARREWTDKPEQFQRPSRSDRPKRFERPERSEGYERPERPARTDTLRQGRSERFERAPRTERPRSALRHEGARAERGSADRTAKRVWKAGTMLCPVPVVMVSCVQSGARPNIVTVAWAGTVCSDPPLLSISLRKATHSHGIIMASREFVVNVPSIDQIKAADLCGVISGRDEDKFARTGLTPAEATTVAAPIIAECPLNLECKVHRVLELGSHTMFIAEVTAVQASEYLITGSDRLALEKAGLAAFAHGEYYALGKKLGFFGYSVRKRKSARKR